MNIKRNAVRLSEREAMYLRNTTFLPEALAQIVRSAAATDDKGIAIVVSRATSEEFRAAFTERVAKVGFDEDYESTNEGKLLEGLIDRFYSQ